MKLKYTLNKLSPGEIFETLPLCVLMKKNYFHPFCSCVCGDEETKENGIKNT